MSEKDVLLALIVEDEPEAVTVLEAALQAAGFDTVVVRDGPTAMAHLGMIIPSVVVLDLALPGISGTDILAEIREDKRLKDCRVIVVTGVPVLIEAVEEMADLVLVKPFSIGQLRNFAVRLAEAQTEDQSARPPR
jgi:DNA-binding response OmpR family regulator